MSHRCPALGCSAQVIRVRVFCPTHWHQVPKGLQDAIWRHWEAGNIPLWLLSVNEAITALSDLTPPNPAETKPPCTRTPT
jgi:hypothetical protein